ncbi:unnamed protein product, partial [Strongylus vulgaris]
MAERTMMVYLCLLIFYLECGHTFQVTHVSECGTTRSCWLLPNGCKSAVDCSVMVTWKHTGRALLLEIEFLLMRLLKGYFIKRILPFYPSMNTLGQLESGKKWRVVSSWDLEGRSHGLSCTVMHFTPCIFYSSPQLPIQGNDTVFECHFPNKGKGSVHLSHNLKTSNIMLREATEMLLKDGYTEVTDGRAFCGAEWVIDFTVLDAKEKKMVGIIVDLFTCAISIKGPK